MGVPVNVSATPPQLVVTRTLEKAPGQDEKVALLTVNVVILPLSKPDSGTWVEVKLLPEEL